MVAAARAAGRSLLRHLAMRDELVTSTKERGDFVSNADLIAERRIAAILRAGYPNYGFLMEESGLQRAQMGNYRWIVDPLDGTTNFLRGVPYFAVSIALQERGRIVAGVVFDPLRREMFEARRGAGAFLNGQRLRVSNRREISQAVIVTGVPLSRGGQDSFLPRLAAMRMEAGGIRSMGAAALDLAYVAAGRYDAYWEEHQAPWDIAAGLLLVKEAGGRCTDLAGKATMLQSGTILASNGHLHAPIRTMLSVNQ
jgi:myo-inositol-1(or 4)-monophosphatase